MAANIHSKNIEIHLKFFEHNFFSEKTTKGNKDYIAHIKGLAENISDAIGNVPSISRRFKYLPEYVQIDVVKERFDACIFPLLSGEAQRFAFDFSSNPAELAKQLCRFDETGTHLSLNKHLLSPMQTCKLLAALPVEVKSKVLVLDLSCCDKMETLESLKDYINLHTLTLPNDQSMPDMENLGTVAEQLKTLNVSSLPIKTLDFLKYCPNLISLNAGSCGMIADIEGLLHCKNLKNLVLPKVSALYKIKLEILNDQQFQTTIVTYE